MTVKATFFFVDRVSAVSAGWSESLYIPRDFARDGFLEVTGSEFAEGPVAAGRYCFRRLAILSVDYRMSAVRCTNVNNRADSVLGFLGTTGGRGQSGDASTGDLSEEPYDALICNMIAGTVARRNFLLRGLPSNVVSRTTDFIPGSFWVTPFNAWKSWLTSANAYQLLHYTPAQIAPPSVLAVAAGAKKIVLSYTGITPVGLVPGARFRVRQTTGATGVNKTWRVAQVVGLDVHTYPQKTTITGVPLGAPLIEILTPSYPAITQVLGKRGAKKSTGRPFFALRGKSVARVR